MGSTAAGDVRLLVARFVCVLYAAWLATPALAYPTYAGSCTNPTSGTHGGSDGTLATGGHAISIDGIAMTNGGSHTLSAGASTAAIVLSGSFTGFLITAAGGTGILGAPSNGKIKSCANKGAVQHDSKDPRTSVTSTLTVPSAAGTYAVSAVAMSAKTTWYTSSFSIVVPVSTCDITINNGVEGVLGSSVGGDGPACVDGTGTLSSGDTCYVSAKAGYTGAESNGIAWGSGTCSCSGGCTLSPDPSDYKVTGCAQNYFQQSGTTEGDLVCAPCPSGQIIAAKLIQTGAQTCAADPNADCTLGDAVTAADCTASCEATLTQTVTTDAVGTGSCAPGTYSCMAGDGACPPEPSAAGRVGVWAVGGAAAALACSAFLMHQYH